MVMTAVGWLGLLSVTTIGLFGFGLYLSLLTFIVFFLIGILTVLYFNYDEKKIFSVDINSLDDPLQQTSFSIQIPKILKLFQKEPSLLEVSNIITGNEPVDTLLNDIITIIINDHVIPWYEILTTDRELTEHSIRRLVIAAGLNVTNRVRSVDWIYVLSTRFPEEFTSHLKLFKQSKVRLKHIHLLHTKEVTDGINKLSPKKQDEKKSHRRNKSDTELPWPPETTTHGKSKFYNNGESSPERTLTDLFFDLECAVENKKICRDIFCTDTEQEYALLCEISEAVLYLVAPEEVWKCHAMKIILIELLTSLVLKPLLELLTDPDNINRAIIRMCCKDISLSSELFLTVVRCSGDAEELDATLELVQKDIQKLHSKDSAGEWEIQDRQKLSSLQYLTRIIQSRRATLRPREGSASNASTEKIPEEISRSLKFLSESTVWRSKAQYSLEIELNENDSTQASKAAIDNLRSSALELCDIYLAPNRPSLVGLPENCYSELVRKINTDGDEFTNNPLGCFDDVQKCIYEALEDDPSWQSDYMMDEQDIYSDLRKDERTEPKKYGEKCKRLMKTCFSKIFHKSRCKSPTGNKYSTFPRSFSRRIDPSQNHTLPKCKRDSLAVPNVTSRHNRSRSDIVGNIQKMTHYNAGTSNLSSTNTSNLSMSHSDINHKSYISPMSACIIETALVQEKGKAFGIYAIAVTNLSSNEVWHIYRRYSDFYDLHSSIKEKWPELSQLPFPAKKTFQNTSRSVLESRKRILNDYLHSLSNLAREARYTALLSPAYLGGFLSPETQAEKHSNTIDALLVNSLRAGMRTLKNMPDQFANTVDGVMDGISKVFQSKGSEYLDGFKSGNNSDGQDEGDDSPCLKLLEEVLGLRGLWLRRKLLAPLRTLFADRVDKKVLELVTVLTSHRNIVTYFKTFKQWLKNRDSASHITRDDATKARTRVAAKVALLSYCSDDLRHIVGTDAARRGLLNVFDQFQTKEINKRLLYILLECILTNLFPDNNIPEMFRRLYSNSSRVPATKRSLNI